MGLIYVCLRHNIEGVKKLTEWYVQGNLIWIEEIIYIYTIAYFNYVYPSNSDYRWEMRLTERAGQGKEFSLL